MAKLTHYESLESIQPLSGAVQTESAPLPIAVVDSARRFHLVNPSFCALLGQTAPTIIGQTIDAFVDREFGAALSHLPVEHILAKDEERESTFYIGRIAGKELQITCSVACALTSEATQLILSVAAVVHGDGARLPAQTFDPNQSEVGGRRSVQHAQEAIDGLRDLLFMSNSSRSLRRMMDYVFGQARRLLHVDEMAVFAPFADLAEANVPGPLIYASDERNTALLDISLLLTPELFDTIERKQRFVYQVNDGNPPISGIAAPAAWLIAPMLVDEEIIGLVVFFFARRAELPPNAEELIASLAEQATVAHGADRLQRMAGTAAALHERERLAREMHDAVMQSIYSLTLFAEAGRRLAALGQTDRVEENLQMLSETAQQALREMRLLLYELKPAVLEQAGLVEALRQRLDAVERRTGMTARLEVKGDVQFPAPMEDGLYRICHEALNNALKHASATEVTVTLQVDDQDIHLDICDNGIGFDPSDSRVIHGEGMATMRERVRRMNGKLVIKSAAQQGTCMRFLLALPNQPEYDSGSEG